jgi:hypothetical protein
MRLLLLTATLLLPACDDNLSTSSRHACADAVALCDGTIEAPLRWDEPDGEALEIAFRRVPRRDVARPAAGVVVAAIGGPAEGHPLC